MNKAKKVGKQEIPFNEVPQKSSWSLYPWQEKNNHVLLRVRVTPRGGKDAVEGKEQLADGSQVLKVRTRMAPQDGEATDSVRRILAKALEISHSYIHLESGATSRVKLFLVEQHLEVLEGKLKNLCS